MSSKRTALTLLTLTVSAVGSMSCATGKDDDLLSIFGEQIDLENSHMNVKASSSVHLDQWLANYLAGKKIIIPDEIMHGPCKRWRPLLKKLSVKPHSCSLAVTILRRIYLNTAANLPQP